MAEVDAFTRLGEKDANQTVLVALAQLQPAPWNPRVITDERFENLCKSILSDPGFMWERPLLANRSGIIYAGNMRYRAVAHLGWPQVPARVVDIPDRLARERALRDNQQWGEWNEDQLGELVYKLQQEGSNLDLLGFEEQALADLLASVGVSTTGGAAEGLQDDPGPQLDKADELGIKWGTAVGQLWEIPSLTVSGRAHRIMCGDSIKPEQVHRLMDGKRSNLMPTDPPYLVDYDGGNHPQSWNGHQKPGQPTEKQWDTYNEADAPTFFDALIRVALAEALTERPAIYQWHAARRASLVEAAWVKNGLLFHQQIIWVKSRKVLGRSHFMWQHEPCMYGWIEGRPPDLKPPASISTIWSIDQQGVSDGTHPTQKPVEVCRWPISWHTKPGALVYEPFSGSGTCLVASEQEGRLCYAMELSPPYVAVALERLKGMGLTPVLVDTVVPPPPPEVQAA